MPASPHRAQSAHQPPVDSEATYGPPAVRDASHPRVAARPASYPRLVPADQRERAAPPRSRPQPRPPEVAPLPELTATGAAMAALVPVTSAAVLDAAISPGLGILFAFVFIFTSVLVALMVRWRDAWAAFAFPPLVFIAAAGIAAQVSAATTGSWLERTSGDIAAAVLDHPFYLLAGTALATVAIAHRARVE